MIRHFPFSRTYKNLAYNLKNFRPSSHRPAFKSTNHPFMSNQQLQEALYSKWIASTLPNRILGHLKAGPRKATRELRFPVLPLPFSSASASATAAGAAPASFYYIPKSLVVDNIEMDSDGGQVGKGLTHEILSHFEKGDFSTMASLLESHLADRATIIEPELLNMLIKLTLSEIPMPEFLPYELQVEVPYHQRHLTPTKVHDTPFYNFIYSRIPDLYRICKAYEKIMFNDKEFQEYHTWLCYHMGDLATIQQLVAAYTKHASEVDSKVLSYAVCLFLSNYNTVQALLVMKDILYSQNLDIDPILLELALQLSIVYDSLYHHRLEIFKLWCDTQARVSPKALALMLRIAHRDSKLTPKDDITPVLQICEDMGVSDHYMIRAQRLKAAILSRHPSKPHKPITKADLEEIVTIADQLKAKEGALQTAESDGTIGALDDFYYQMMYFFALDIKNLNMVLFILRNMKDDNVAVSAKFVKLILRYYASSGKFISLVEFLKFSYERLTFDRQFVAYLYEGFVRAYPYMAPEFDIVYQKWLSSMDADRKMPSSESGAAARVSYQSSARKDHSAAGLTLKSSSSILLPYTLYRPLHPIKYNPKHWEPLSRPETQIYARFHGGFNDLNQRGVKPDFFIIKETYKKLPAEKRHMVLDIMKNTKSESPRKSLAIYRIQTGDYPKKYLADYIEHEGNGLSPNERLSITTTLQNKGLARTAIRLLKTIPAEQLNDQASMVRLERLLQLNISTKQYKQFVKLIDQFPINEVVLSPYLYKKCCKIEDVLVKKIEKKKAASQTDVAVVDQELSTQLNLAHSRLQSFIADIQIRLASDKMEISEKIVETFKLLNKWMENDKNMNDERKV